MAPLQNYLTGGLLRSDWQPSSTFQLCGEPNPLPIPEHPTSSSDGSSNSQRSPMPDLRSAITDQDHIQGDPEAPLTLLEYGDFQCPRCLNAHRIVKRLTTHFGPTLRLVYRN